MKSQFRTYTFLETIIGFVFSVIFDLIERSGEISADDSAVSITYRFWNVNVFKRKLEYSVIDYASADVKTAPHRFGVSYWLILSIKTKDEKTIRLKSELYISNDVIANEPDKYKEYLSNHSLTKISDFINEKVQGVWRA